MKHRLICFALLLSLLLGGCSWGDGSYLSTAPHQEQLSGVQSGTISASNYQQLRSVLTQLVENGTESAVIHVAEYEQDLVESNMEAAIKFICDLLPLGAYAVEKIDYDIGTGGGQPAISVNISYIHGRSEIRKIRMVSNVEEAEEVIGQVLEQCAESMVLLVRDYKETDLVQMIEDYALQNPDTIMETPQVAVGIYPDSGVSRVVELKFTYQTSRDSLRQMQPQVQRVFESASLYVSSDDAEAQKYAQLFAFLSERFNYQFETSITPSYSLLCHGVGDSKAFALVYAAMCHQADLECYVVSGTKDGEAWCWNMIREDEAYYHVDLLQSRQLGQFTRLTDDVMQGYVWDYSAYPATETAAVEP